MTGRQYGCIHSRVCWQHEAGAGAKGALLTPFVYLEPEGNAINIGMNYRFNHALSNMSVTQLEYRDPKVIMLSAEGSLTLTPDLRD